MPLICQCDGEQLYYYDNGVYCLKDEECEQILYSVVSAKLEHVHQRMKKEGASWMLKWLCRLTQISEEYEVATQAIQIMSAANIILKAVQQLYIDQWNAK